MNWEKTDTRINANGERIVTYEFMDMKIQSRRMMIPHANRSGGWLHTSYFLIWPDGYEEEFRTLRDAKAKGEEEILKR